MTQAHTKSRQNEIPSETGVITERYLSLSGMDPAYLAAHCQLDYDEGRRQLRSATSRTCVVR